MKGQMILGIQAENRVLREKLQLITDQQNQAAFIEQLTAAALGGYCTHPWASQDEVILQDGRKVTGPQRAAELAQIAAETVIDKIIAAVREADKLQKERLKQQADQSQGDQGPETEAKSNLIL